MKQIRLKNGILNIICCRHCPCYYSEDPEDPDVEENCGFPVVISIPSDMSFPESCPLEDA